MAPEIYKTKSYGATVDIFSLGVIFYYIVYGKMPFGNEFNEVCHFK
jgi:serine/threonine protein kinase